MPAALSGSQNEASGFAGGASLPWHFNLALQPLVGGACLPTDRKASVSLHSQVGAGPPSR